VNKTIAKQQVQTQKNGMCKLPNQRNTKPLHKPCTKQFTTKLGDLLLDHQHVPCFPVTPQ